MNFIVLSASEGTPIVINFNLVRWFEPDRGEGKIRLTFGETDELMQFLVVSGDIEAIIRALGARSP